MAKMVMVQIIYVYFSTTDFIYFKNLMQPSHTNLSFQITIIL